jgi:dTDP-4-amino-4,6-dideoxygalactose transaminase
MVEPYLKQMDASHVYSNFGPLVRQVEIRFADFLQIDPAHVVSCANATLALAGCMQTLPRNQWLLPDWTFAATGHAAASSGKQFLFRDVSWSNWYVKPEEADRVISDSVGLVSVVPFGTPVDLSSTVGFECGIVDAAASLGNATDMQPIPAGWAVVFSLHATKVLGCGEGALVAFGSTTAAANFRSWTNFGFQGSRVSMIQATNAKMSEVHAAYALAALDQWPDERQQWMDAQEVASDVMFSLGLTGVPTTFVGVSPYWMVEFETSELTRHAEQALGRVGVQTRRWWPEPLSEMPPFSAHSDVLTPVSRDISRRVLGLPMYRGLPNEVGSIVRQSLEPLLSYR